MPSTHSAPATPSAERSGSGLISSSSTGSKSTGVMNIQSLLNPSAIAGLVQPDTMGTPSTTTRDTPVDSFMPSSLEPDTPSTTKGYGRTATYYDNTKRTKTTAKAINFPTFEIHEDSICLSSAQHDELLRQHKRFNVKPSGIDETDLISRNTKHIPYSSEKKEFFGKTGRDGFNVFHYTFQVPGDPDTKPYTVMWDYENGLVRITPFFKACNHAKTVPAKALSTNPGLKELAHSITGGALAAQGYWIPYQCARAICLTFCYDIRWPLVHVFGPSFIRECLPRSDPGFGKFKIGRDVIHLATLEAQQWKATSSVDDRGDAASSVPPEANSAATQTYRYGSSRPNFKQGSPFDPDDDTRGVGRRRRIETRHYESTVSPKTTSSDLSYISSGWTSVNRPHRRPNSPLNNTSVRPLTTSLLTQPHFGPWRPLDSGVPSEHVQNAIKMPTGAHDINRRTRRLRSSIADDGSLSKPDHHHEDADVNLTESEGDDDDLPVQASKRQKRAARYKPGMYLAASSSADASTASSMTGLRRGKSKVLRTQEFRAAQALMKMCSDDAALATKSNQDEE